METAYRNTDLVLSSAEDLTPLAAALARSICRMYPPEESNGLWYVSFDCGEQFSQPEQSIARLLEAVEGLDPPLRETWDRCCRREFNLGYDCGHEPASLGHELSQQLVQRLAAVGGMLAFTLYRLGDEG